MRTVLAGLACGILCGLLSGATSALADNKPDMSGYVVVDDVLDAGEQMEGARRWGDAIELYQSALERWEEDPDLTYALRRTRVHFGIERRYTDNSFEDRLLTMGRAEALDLMEDVLSRVQMEYVSPVSATQFIAHGTESLYMALSNPRFVEHHLASAGEEQIDSLKGRLIRDYWNRRVGSRLEARSVVTEVCEHARRTLGLDSASVVMEYIFGGCNVLDDYSQFLTPDRYNDLTGSIQGEFVGIGIEMIAEPEKGMHLVRVLIDSPAEQGGLRADDYIVKIDGTNCRNMTSDEAAQLLRGLEGTRVTLGYETPEGDYNEAQFVRRPVRVKSITRAMIIDEERGVGFIKQSGFQSSTVEELDLALQQLESRGMKSLIWDLRGNPGGLLDTAPSVIDRFVRSGVLVTTEGRSVDQNQTFQARDWDTRDYPLVLLVDENSASASEIVAGAIRDHKRGTIVGRTTYGKWSVQSIIHLPGGTGLKLTTAKFFSPSHGNYAGIGLAPHEVVNRDGERSSSFRARTRDEIRNDADVVRALEILDGSRAARKGGF